MEVFAALQTINTLLQVFQMTNNCLNKVQTSEIPSEALLSKALEDTPVQTREEFFRNARLLGSPELENAFRQVYQDFVCEKQPLTKSLSFMVGTLMKLDTAKNEVVQSAVDTLVNTVSSTVESIAGIFK